MYTWSIYFTYVEGYGDGVITERYYVRGDDDIEAIDKALTLFLNDFGLDFDTDIENIEWDCCKI
jgi:hypothetical protein